ncbi:hypothetical protein [Aquimarina sp. 2201CG14-23]|uniref:hypothetical protein n=1 Tax=Aquimarina mycalae TaxID=3040073 RepID=UPI002477CDDB|nr:hypothetical protein [Aquimarina sp. 2201CG14-23]MDH7444193.1 hypothetical protein [Aquimarina sp. 2201CG14-23]
MNWDSKKVWKEEVISKQFIKYLKETEVHKLIKDKETQLGVISERDIINWLDKEENEDFWNQEMEHHICEKIIKDDDDYFVGCDYEDFKNAYFFVASLWKTEKGGDLIILEHYH